MTGTSKTITSKTISLFWTSYWQKLFLTRMRQSQQITPNKSNQTDFCQRCQPQSTCTTMLHWKALPGTALKFHARRPNRLPRFGGVVGHRTAGNYICSQETSLIVGSIGANDLKRQGQRHLPHRLRQWKHGTRLIDGIVRLDGFGFSHLSVCIGLSFSYIGCSLNVSVWLWKIGDRLATRDSADRQKKPAR